MHFPFLKKQKFLSSENEPVLDKKRSFSVHLQPPGKKPFAWLKVIQTVPLSAIKKPVSFACSSALFLTHCLCLSNSCFLFATLYLSTELQWCMRSMAAASDPTPVNPGFKLSSPG